MINWLDLLLIVLFLIAAIPIVCTMVYLCVKLGTLAYLRGLELFLTEAQKNKGDGL